METCSLWVVLGAILILSTILHISENGFLKLTLQHFEDEKKLSTTTLRARRFVEDPVYLLITFHVLKVIFILAIAILVFSLLLCMKLQMESMWLFSFLVTLVLLYVFIELIPSLFLRCPPLACFKIAFPLVVPLEWVVRNLSFLFPFSRKHYSDRLEKKDVITLNDIGEALNMRRCITWMMR